MLDSPLPAVASIVSALAMPADGAEGMPVACVNLNQKPARGSYGVVLGHRGRPCPARPGSWPPLPADLDVSPVPALFDNQPPPGFIGRRAGFAISQPVVEWSLAVACQLLGDWLGRRAGDDRRCGCCAGREGIDASLAVVQGYHSSGGGAFGALFGEGWVRRLFQEDMV